MIDRSGDLFTTEAKVIGHGVNTRGVMGAGIAVAFRNRWPQMYEEYRLACEDGSLVAGSCLLWETGSEGVELVANIASQDFPGPHASLSWLDQGATCAAAGALERGYDTIAIPRIGAGIGGLDWDEAAQVLRKVEEETGITFEVWTL